MKLDAVNFLRARGKQTAIAGAIFVVVIVGLLVAVGGWGHGAADVAHDPHTRAVVARGRIEPLGRARTVQGPVSAIIHKLAVREGDMVKAGDVLAETDTRQSFQAALAMEEKRLAEAQQQLAQVSAPAKQSDIEAQNAAVRKLRVDAQRLKKDFDRANDLVGQHFISVETLDARRAAMEQADHALTQAEWTQRSLLKPRDIDVQVAAARVATQKDAVEKARADLELTQIRAPVDGTILTLMVREGEALGSDGLLQIGDLRNLIAIAEVDEFDIARVSLKRKATITGPSLTKPVTGTVSRISSAVYKQKRPTSDVLVGRDAQIVEVEVTPDEPLPPVVWGEITVAITGAP